MRGDGGVMIKRRYFISTKCGHSNGTPSYSYDYSLFYRKSLFPQHDKAYAKAIDDAGERYERKGLNAKDIEVISFNRI